MSELQAFQQLEQHLNQRVVGQPALMRRLLLALLADGHLLVEGAPGLAKTRAIKELAACLEGDFHRVQFTPDLLPADLTGTDIYRPGDGSFQFQAGPLFHNLLLADEINRAPAKVQSALLEAMAERQVTVGSTSHPLPPLFLVMATQNPIEQEGTYPLPEAQLDRFLMYTRVTYPDARTEAQILALSRQEALEGPQRPQRPVNGPLLTQRLVFAARQQVMGVHLAPQLEAYLIRLVLATRDPAPFGGELARWVRFGASPRATIALDRCSRAHAWLVGREFVTPEDIHAVAHDILRHRILLSFEAEADGITSDRMVDHLLARVAIP